MHIHVYNSFRIQISHLTDTISFSLTPPPNWCFLLSSKSSHREPRLKEEKKRQWLVRLRHSQVFVSFSLNSIFVEIKFLRDGNEYCVLLGAPDAFVQSFGFPVTQLPNYEKQRQELKIKPGFDIKNEVTYKARVAATLVDAQIFVCPVKKYIHGDQVTMFQFEYRNKCVYQMVVGNNVNNHNCISFASSFVK